MPVWFVSFFPPVGDAGVSTIETITLVILFTSSTNRVVVTMSMTAVGSWWCTDSVPSTRGPGDGGYCSCFTIQRIPLVYCRQNKHVRQWWMLKVQGPVCNSIDSPYVFPTENTRQVVVGKDA